MAIQKSATEWLVMFYSRPQAWPEATALWCAMVQEGHTASPDPALLDAVKGNGEDLGGVGASRGKEYDLNILCKKILNEKKFQDCLNVKPTMEKESL